MALLTTREGRAGIPLAGAREAEFGLSTEAMTARSTNSRLVEGRNRVQATVTAVRPLDP
ncbi:MAG: hypothetical protein O7A65_08420 [Proteobacteria bacterium]|nr:hypothetical protein [Pseudomonadota bacterium]